MAATLVQENHKISRLTAGKRCEPRPVEYCIGIRFFPHSSALKPTAIRRGTGSTSLRAPNINRPAGRSASEPMSRERVSLGLQNRIVARRLVKKMLSFRSGVPRHRREGEFLGEGILQTAREPAKGFTLVDVVPEKPPVICRTSLVLPVQAKPPMPQYQSLPDIATGGLTNAGLP